MASETLDHREERSQVKKRKIDEGDVDEEKEILLFVLLFVLFLTNVHNLSQTEGGESN